MNPDARGRLHEALGELFGTQAGQGFTNCRKSSHTALLTTLKRLEVSTTLLGASIFLGASRDACPDSDYRIDPPYHIFWRIGGDFRYLS